ncbi:MAG TPA: hypothetical protein VME23_03230 [Terracidiphilus sp.]|nr:hypothetical protein [Terracidiphilus sp.]
MTAFDIAGLAIKGALGILDSLDEDGLRYSCSEGSRADCDALRHRLQ